MPNRPSLAVLLFKRARPFEALDRNPFNMVTANQLNALREYIEYLEKQVELSRNTSGGNSTPAGSAPDTGRGSDDAAGESQNRDSLG